MTLPYALRYTYGMFGLSLGHLLILSFVVLLFTSRRLPELGHALGKGIAAFKRGIGEKDPDGIPPNKEGALPDKSDRGGKR